MDSDSFPWEQLSDESNQWFSRFETYRLMGPERSILRVYRQIRQEKAGEGSKGQDKPPKSVPNSWNEAVIRFEWRKRAEAWDAHQREQRRQRYEQREHERMGEWQEVRDKLMGSVHRMIKQVDTMLKHPLIEREENNIVVAEYQGQEIPQQVITKPINFTASSPALIALRAAKLAKLTVPDEGAAILLLSGLGYEIYDGEGNAMAVDFEEQCHEEN